jgi:hypothetical protein
MRRRFNAGGVLDRSSMSPPCLAARAVQALLLVPAGGNRQPARQVRPLRLILRPHLRTDRQCSPRHRMSRNDKNEGSKRVTRTIHQSD